MSSVTHASIWDTLFPPKPFQSSAEALSEIKDVYTIVYKCVTHPVPDWVDPLAATDKPFPVCEDAWDSYGEFKQRYEITPESAKSPIILEYLKKIGSLWTSLP